MIEGKDAGWDAKRRARDKAHKRFIKNKHFILPGMFGLILIGSLIGGTVTLTYGGRAMIDGALIGALALTMIGMGSILRDLAK